MSLPAFTPITTERLYLRLMRDDDLAALWDINGDPEVTRYLPFAAWRTPDDATGWLQRTRERCADGLAQQLVLELRDSGHVAGTALLFRYDATNGRLEVGYAMGRRWWGRGYMKEALLALVPHAFDTLGIRRLEAEADIHNVGSNAVLRSLGFVHEGVLRERWINQGRPVTTNSYGYLAHEWQAMQLAAGDSR